MLESKVVGSEPPPPPLPPEQFSLAAAVRPAPGGVEPHDTGYAVTTDAGNGKVLQRDGPLGPRRPRWRRRWPAGLPCGRDWMWWGMAWPVRCVAARAVEPAALSQISPCTSARFSPGMACPLLEGQPAEPPTADKEVAKQFLSWPETQQFPPPVFSGPLANRAKRRCGTAPPKPPKATPLSKLAARKEGALFRERWRAWSKWRRTPWCKRAI